jgi:REP element-mobilizing transposase RayT
MGETNLHLQFTPAYRRDIFSEKLVGELTVAYILERAKEMKIEVAAIECEPDHLHLFVKKLEELENSSYCWFVEKLF